MDFSIFCINNVSDKTLLDYIINIAGMIIIPVVIYFLSSVYQEGKKDRERKIQSLNSLTLYCKNLLQEVLKLRNNEERRRNALNDYIKNPQLENFTKAFYIVRTPTLQYELYANHFDFTTTHQYFSIVDLIFEINSNLKTVTAFITEFNLNSELALKTASEERIKIAKEMLLQLDFFRHQCSILSYIVYQLINAIKIYNSYYFFQDIINIDFKGKMKQLLDEVNVELDRVYNPRDCEWRNTFIENIENPPVNFTCKDVLKNTYLKFCGHIDKKKRLLRQELYAIWKKKECQKLNTAKTLCLPEKIQELNTGYKKILENFDLCEEIFHSIETIGDINIQLYKGLIKKLKQIVTAMKNIFAIFPPERTTMLSLEEIAQIEINTNFITTNFIPCLNNIFKFLYLYYFPNENTEEINFINPKLNEILDAGYQEKLQAFSNSELYKFIEAYDYSISHELPFELEKGLQDDKNLYVGIKIMPNDIAKGNGIKAAYLHEFVIKSINLLVETTNDAYLTILKNSRIKIKNDF